MSLLSRTAVTKKRPRAALHNEPEALSTTIDLSSKRRKITTRTDKQASVVSETIVTAEQVTGPPDSAVIGDIQLRLESLEQDTMGTSWYDALQPEFEKPYFKKLKDFLASEIQTHTVYPSLNDIYSWSRLTPIDKVRVVVLGQDPYHNVGQAHGLSFSVLPPTKLPGSLKNIFKQISLDYPHFKPPSSGDLTSLAKLGVLWLNTSLTVRAHKAASHSRKGWETFTGQVLRAIVSRERSPGVVFLAWGLHAQKTCDSIGIDEKTHLVLKSAHPSPLSAHRGFLGNGHFRRTNEWLHERYGEEIDWTALGAL